MSLKITFIGAGSVVFSKQLASDLLQFPDLDGISLCLMDINAERLRVAEAVVRQLLRDTGSKARLEVTMDRRKAVAEAKYVITMMQVGGYRPATVIDFEIPRKYGLRQTIGDTLGIGGIFRGLRTIPELVAVANDIADVGHPDCLLMNYSNPMAINCWAVGRAVGVPVVGLCHSVFSTARQLSKFLGIPYEKVDYQVAGINHMAFFLKFSLAGQDLYPALFDIALDPHFNLEKVRFELMRRLGYFVTESSTHLSEYVPYFIPHGHSSIRKNHIVLDAYLQQCELLLSRWSKVKRELLKPRPDKKIQPQSEEYGTHIIHARETGQSRTVYANVRNGGLIANLPEDCCVEVPCLVDGSGLHPVCIGNMPPQLAALCQTNINVQRLAVEAALTGKREHIYHAAMLDPHTAATLPLKKIWDLCDDLIAAHQMEGLVPRLQPTVPTTGRTADGIANVIRARLSQVGPFTNTAGAVHAAQVTVYNPTSRQVVVPLSIECPSECIQVEGKSRLKVKVPSGKSVSQPISVRCLQALFQPVYIELKTTDARVLALGAELVPHPVISIRNGRQFTLSDEGVDVGSVMVKRRAEGFHITMEIRDMRLRDSQITSPSQGSSIELLFNHWVNGRSYISHLCLAPAARSGGKALGWHTNGNPEPRIDVRQGKADAGGYRLVADIPDAVVAPGSSPLRHIQFSMEVHIAKPPHGKDPCSVRVSDIGEINGSNGNSTTLYLEW